MDADRLNRSVKVEAAESIEKFELERMTAHERDTFVGELPTKNELHDDTRVGSRRAKVSVWDGRYEFTGKYVDRPHVKRLVKHWLVGWLAG